MPENSAHSAWVPLFCTTDKKVRVATFQQVGSEWQLVKVSEKGQSKDEGPPPGRLEVSGPFALSPEYHGCPVCEKPSFACCGHCSALGCWDRVTVEYWCPSCGGQSEIRGKISSVNAMETS